MTKVNSIKVSSEKYPKRLAETENPPEKLYYKGNYRNELFKDCLAVVGTRQMTKYGRKATKKLVTEIAANGITIVSGFMYGLDAKAHQSALKVNGNTIAVMPCGIKRINPSHQKDLYKEILQKEGLIMSELPENTKAKKWTFVKRNRIVAGLSQATLVIEGGPDSGTLITAEKAKEYNRKLFAVPCPITSEVSKAPNSLIKNKAQAVTKPEDILKFFNVKNKENQKEASKTSKDKPNNQTEKEIIKLLKRESLTMDEISEKTPQEIDSKKLNTTLSKMELSGKIEEESGKYYVNKT
ncbi:MAG: DNA-processing protein DprA [Candidatus Magasanikbacteria bacterium]